MSHNSLPSMPRDHLQAYLGTSYYLSSLRSLGSVPVVENFDFPYLNNPFNDLL